VLPFDLLDILSVGNFHVQAVILAGSDLFFLSCMLADIKCLRAPFFGFSEPFISFVPIVRDSDGVPSFNQVADTSE